MSPCTDTWLLVGADPQRMGFCGTPLHLCTKTLHLADKSHAAPAGLLQSNCSCKEGSFLQIPSVFLPSKAICWWFFREPGPDVLSAVPTAVSLVSHQLCWPGLSPCFLRADPLQNSLGISALVITYPCPRDHDQFPANLASSGCFGFCHCSLSLKPEHQGSSSWLPRAMPC